MGLFLCFLGSVGVGYKTQPSKQQRLTMLFHGLLTLKAPLEHITCHNPMPTACAHMSLF